MSPALGSPGLTPEAKRFKAEGEVEIATRICNYCRTQFVTHPSCYIECPQCQAITCHNVDCMREHVRLFHSMPPSDTMHVQSPALTPSSASPYGSPASPVATVPYGSQCTAICAVCNLRTCVGVIRISGVTCAESQHVCCTVSCQKAARIKYTQTLEGVATQGQEGNTADASPSLSAAVPDCPPLTTTSLPGPGTGVDVGSSVSASVTATTTPDPTITPAVASDESLPADVTTHNVQEGGE